MYSARHAVYISCKQVYFVPFFFKRGVYVWHRTLMRLFPSQFLEPPVPSFLGARPAWIPPCCTVSPWGIGPGSSWGKLGSLPRQPGTAPRKCHLRIQPYHMDIRAFPLGIWSESEKLNFSARLTTPQSVVDLKKKNRYRITSANMKNLMPRSLGTTPRFKIGHAHFALSPHPQLRQLRLFFNDSLILYPIPFPHH